MTERTLGRYRVLRRIKQGGMAEVLEAIAEGPGGFERKVAIKRVLASSSTEMFIDEARIASQLHHANIVGVLDYGTADGMPFQVLELVDGLDVGELLDRAEERDKPLSPVVALYIATEVAHALAHAHEARDSQGRDLGVVHRDISPGNVLVSWSGDVKLTDFGIALSRSRLHETLDGSAKGTLLYMAPEQLVRGHIDAATDVFGLGCLLVEMLAGESPLAGGDTLSEVLAGRELPLPEGLDPDIEALLRRALSPSRVQRHATGKELARDLGRLMAVRLEGDPRSLLREWLEALGDEEPGDDAGAMGLFDIQMISTTERGVRLFETQPHTKRHPGRAESDVAGSSSPSAEPGARSARRRWLMPTLLTGTVALGTAVAIVWSRPTSPSGRPPAPPSAASGAMVATTFDAGAAASPTPTMDAASPSPESDARTPRDRRPDRSRPKRSNRKGVLLVGGAGAHRAEIIVDGRSHGFAPKRLTLPGGRHRVVLVRPDGRRVTRKLRLSAKHTASSPYRWIVPK